MKKIDQKNRALLKIVCIGGGTGLSTLLRGLRNYWLDISAIVTMFDSGGSSGKLRDRFGVLPPGDPARCAIALSDNEKQWREALLVRFQDNHSAVNLMMSALERLSRDFQEAIDKFCHLVSAKGRVFPVTLDNSHLCADLKNSKKEVTNEVEVDKAMQADWVITNLYLNPPVGSNPLAIEAIKEADIICIGPGSLYTSLLSNIIVPGVRDALAGSDAPIFFILNLTTEGAGMDHLNKVEDVVLELENYLKHPITKIIVNQNFPEEKIAQYAEEGKQPFDFSGVINDSRFTIETLWEYEPCLNNVTSVRHDSMKLATIVYREAIKLLN